MRALGEAIPMIDCGCTAVHERRRIVLTGGPGAGKTAVLELVRGMLCQHLRVAPESASILFGGGFPRDETRRARAAAQLAIFAVQRQLEVVFEAQEPPGLTLCDRGTLDALAYWPGPAGEFWDAVRSSRAIELARYSAVIHMRPPAALHGWENRNPLRTETAPQAAAIDARIVRTWEGHPRRLFIETAPDFLAKARRAGEAISAELPICCRPRLEPVPA
jgi:predicted ATPase